MVSGTGRPLRRAGRLGVLSTAVIAIVLSAAVACGDDEPDPLGDGSLGVVRVAAGERIPIRLVLALTAAGSSGVASEDTARLAVADFGPIRGFDVDIGGTVDEFCDPGEASRRRRRSLPRETSSAWSARRARRLR